VDKADKPIEPSRMRRHYALKATVLVALAAPLACSVKQPTQAGETPMNGSDDTPPSGPSKGSSAGPSGDSSASPDAPPPSKDTSVPDDYQMTNRDCIELGGQFSNVIRADESAKLSPKLKDKQREAAEQSIEKAANARGQQWTDTCVKSLAGTVQDRSKLKCAMDSKSAKAFDECLNGPGGSGKK
jgi:hypothetical protein